MPLLATKHFLFQASDDGGSLLHNLGPIMLFFGQTALTFGRGTTCSLTFIAPVGFGAQQAGVFGLLEEEILHIERRDFVRRHNRGVRKICRGKQTKVSRPLYFNSSGSELWSEEDWLSGGVQRSGTETE